MTFANSGRGKICTTEVTNFLFEEFGRKLEQAGTVKVDIAHLSGAKTSRNDGSVSVKCQKLSGSQYQSGENLVREPFWYFRMFLVFLDVSGAAQLSNARNWWAIEGYHKKMSKIIFLRDKMREGVVLVFLEVSFLLPKHYAKLGYQGSSWQLLCPKKPRKVRIGNLLCFWKSQVSKNKRGITIFLRKFLSHSTDKFHRRIFLVCVCEHLPVLGIDCTCMLHMNTPGKTLKNSLWSWR